MQERMFAIMYNMVASILSLTGRKIIYIFVAPTGGGKGKQAGYLKDAGVAGVEMGEEFRALPKDHPFQAFLSAREPVPDPEAIQFFKDKFKPISGNAITFSDGMPRLISQFEDVIPWLKSLGFEPVFVYLDVPENVCVERMYARRNEVNRNDATDALIRKGLDVYREHTEPVIPFATSYGLPVLHIEIQDVTQPLDVALLIAQDAFRRAFEGHSVTSNARKGETSTQGMLAV